MTDPLVLMGTNLGVFPSTMRHATPRTRHDPTHSTVSIRSARHTPFPLC